MTFTHWVVLEKRGNIEHQVRGVGETREAAWKEAGIKTGTHGCMVVRCTDNILLGDHSCGELVWALGEPLYITDLDLPEDWEESSHG